MLNKGQVDFVIIRLTFFVLFTLITGFSWGQSVQSLIQGRITDTSGSPIAQASIKVKNTLLGTASDEKGKFRLSVMSGAITLEVSHVSHQTKTLTLNLKAQETRDLLIKLSPKTQELEEVEVAGQGENEAVRDQAGSLDIRAKTVQSNISAFGDFNQALTGQLGVVGNNELSASYAVRGGNFDENLVYVNGMEVYRPFLVRAGQQEGLSFINPDMVQNIEFSAGGWQPKYGDKLSSVLSVAYKAPTKTAATLRGSLLGGGLHLEGRSKGKRLTHVSGIRYKSARYLLNTLETDGQYLPRFLDFQTFLTYDLSKDKDRKTVLSFLGNIAVNRYEVAPESRTTNFGTFQQAFRLFVAFVGEESLRYQTWQSGLRLSHQHSSRFRSHFTLSAMQTQEREYVDIEGGYRLCDVDKNPNSSAFNQCILTRGIGTQYSYARNALDATILTGRTQHEWQLNERTKMEFGVRYDWQVTDDVLNEYAFRDSADFVQVEAQLNSQQEINTPRVSAYWQQTHYLDDSRIITYGTRFLYWHLGNQVLFSPRIQYASRPNWAKNLVWRWAVGLYQQPPFYREMRDFDGTLNRDLKPQSSVHVLAGIDYNFKIWGRPFKFLAETYYKQLWNVVPYDIDNVRLRYYAQNNATAQIIGFDTRISGEFIPGAESWFNVSLLSAREDVEEDGRGSIRRPSDQRLTVGVFFQDNLPNLPSWKVRVKLLYGSGFPYGPPNNYAQRATLKGGTTYNRVDIGLSKMILRAPKEGQNGIKSIWIGLDVLNLVGVSNNISFNWIPDFSGNQYAVPNSLSQRFFNARVVIKY